jgi:hypothetical protein
MTLRRATILSVLIPTIALTAQAQDERLSGEVSQLWHQNSEGVRATAEKDDEFGQAVTWGDFNNDARPDLVVGVPGESVGGAVAAGAVFIFYGSDDLMVSTRGVQVFDQGNNAVKGAAEAYDRFGAALAAGDLNGDGIDDLAIGVPGEAVGDVRGAGAVAVLFGTRNGLLATGNELFYEGNTSFAPGRPARERAHFGSSLAIGDFYGNGRPRLVVGMPGATVDGNVEAGEIGFVFPTNNGGWSLTRVLHQGNGRIKGRPEAGDQFGASLAVGDFNGDGKDDLVAGAPGQTVSKEPEAGTITVMFGSQDGVLETSSNVVLSQVAYGIEGEAEYGDLFGWSLTTGDYNGDGKDDLAVGIPGEDVGDIENAGAVAVLYGDESITRLGGVNQLWNQDAIKTSLSTMPIADTGAKPTMRGVEPKSPTRTLPGANTTLPSQQQTTAKVPTVNEPPEKGDQFGTAVASGDFDLDGLDDLAIGVPNEDLADANSMTGTGMNVGIVQVLYGSRGDGLGSAKSQIFSQETQGVAGKAESGDRFGAALAGGALRLVVGVPGEAIGDLNNAGCVNAVYSSALATE